jgi:hypothetical protein
MKYEFDTTILPWQDIQNFLVEDKNAIDVIALLQCMQQCCILETVQIASKPRHGLVKPAYENS